MVRHVKSIDTGSTMPTVLPVTGQRCERCGRRKLSVRMRARGCRASAWARGHYVAAVPCGLDVRRGCDNESQRTNWTHYCSFSGAAAAAQTWLVFSLSSIIICLVLCCRQLQIDVVRPRAPPSSKWAHWSGPV